MVNRSTVDWLRVQSSKRHSSLKKTSSSAAKAADSASSELSQLVAQVPSTSDFDLAQFIVAMGVIRAELRSVRLHTLRR